MERAPGPWSSRGLAVVALAFSSKLKAAVRIRPSDSTCGANCDRPDVEVLQPFDLQMAASHSRDRLSNRRKREGCALRRPRREGIREQLRDWRRNSCRLVISDDYPAENYRRLLRPACAMIMFRHLCKGFSLPACLTLVLRLSLADSAKAARHLSTRHDLRANQPL